MVDGHPLDLTYMEYELLKFFVTHPGKVFTREQLLSRVWGYEYYGGARTVDVHVRRLRAKLGEEHANLIHTVRSVGYRFGQSRWSEKAPALWGRRLGAGHFERRAKRSTATSPAPIPRRSGERQQCDHENRGAGSTRGGWPAVRVARP